MITLSAYSSSSTTGYLYEVKTSASYVAVRGNGYLNLGSFQTGAATTPVTLRFYADNNAPGALYTTQVDAGTVIDLRGDGWMDLGHFTVTGVVPVPPVNDFTAAVKAAWDADKVLNWTGGDVTLPAPIVLLVTTAWKFGFGLRCNGAKITAAFNDPTKHAITIAMQVTNGHVVQNVGIRNLQITDANFVGTSPFAGALKFECLSNGSWIGNFLVENVGCDGHTHYAYSLVGSVFECVLDKLRTSNGVGALWIERAGVSGLPTDPDMGLPSAIYCYSPDFRDGTGNAIEMACVQAYTEPFDLTVRDGYLVTYGGKGIVAPSGITCVDGTGFEYIMGGAAMALGYRGGLIKNCRGANPVANATPTHGMKYLVDCGLSNNRLVLEDCRVENEGSGTGVKLGRIAGTGTVNLNRSGPASGLDGSGPTVVVQTP